MMAEKPKRKRTTLKQRLTPCECCGYPISQRHHLLPHTFWGETNHTRQFCPNCHELYHIIERLLCGDDKSERHHARLLIPIVEAWGSDDPRLVYMDKLVREAIAARLPMSNLYSTMRVFEKMFGG